jgi:hypothetical protein
VFPSAILSNSLPKTKIIKGKKENVMARPNLNYLPHGNPCAQCAEPIAAPDWIESGPRQTAYLWHCRACGYRFEALAYFAEPVSDSEPLAA